MNKTRLLAFPLTLALALAGASAVVAQDESPAAEMPEVAEYNEDEALVLYHAIQERMLLAGVAEEDIPAAMEDLAAQYGNLSEEDLADLAEAYIASEALSRFTEEVGVGDFGFLGDDDDDDDMDDDAEDEGDDDAEDEGDDDAEDDDGE